MYNHIQFAEMINVQNKFQYDFFISLKVSFYLPQVTYNQVQPLRISHPASQLVHIIKIYNGIATINSQGFGKSLPIQLKKQSHLVAN